MIWQVEREKYECGKCGWIWFTRLESDPLPKICPRCKTKRWNDGEESETSVGKGFEVEGQIEAEEQIEDGEQSGVERANGGEKPSKTGFTSKIHFGSESDLALFNEFRLRHGKLNRDFRPFLLKVAENWLNKTGTGYLTTGDALELAKKMSVIITEWSFNYYRKREMTEGVEYIRVSGEGRRARFLFDRKGVERFFRLYRQRQAKRVAWRKRYRALRREEKAVREPLGAKEKAVIRRLPIEKMAVRVHHKGIVPLGALEEGVYS